MSSAKQVFDCVILFLLKRTNDQICAEYEFMPFNQTFHSLNRSKNVDFMPAAKATF